MTKVDLSDAYLHVTVNRRHRRWLAFRALDRIYRFRVMIFGLAAAPYVFTQMIKPIVRRMRQLGHRVSFYLDDALVLGRSAEEAARATAALVSLLKRLGWRINKKKSVTVPSQRIEYLGVQWDSVEWTVRVPAKKIRDVRRQARRVLLLNSNNSLSVRKLAQLAGKIVSFLAAHKAAAFRRHAIQRNVDFGLRRRSHRGDYDAPITLSATALRDCRWWASKAPTRDNSRRIRWTAAAVRRLPQLTTDGSPSGWGAVLRMSDGSTHEAHGFWSNVEACRSQNTREAAALHRAFFAFNAMWTRSSAIAIRTDNTTVLSILRRFGSRHRHLGVELEPVLRAILRQRLDVFASHVAGVDNVEADRLSRLR